MTSLFVPSLRPALVAAFLYLIAAQPLFSQTTSDTAALRDALDAAIQQTGRGRGLDAAYELLGIAGSARQQGNKEIETQALHAFENVAVSATAEAVSADPQTTHDAIDQLVDLKIFAAVNDVNSIQPVLDDALSQLIPTIESRISQAALSGPWERRFAALGDLGDLEAAAEQADLAAMVELVHGSYEAALTAADKDAAAEPDQSLGSANRDMLAAIRQTHDERVADARANKFSVVAAEVRDDANDEGGASSGPESGDAVGASGQTGESSCVEIAVPSSGGVKAISQRFLQLEIDCRESGRAPIAGRCPLIDLSYICYADAGSDEQITYVYRGTPEESYLRDMCGVLNLVDATAVPTSGAEFRNPNMTLAIACGLPGQKPNN